MKYSISLVVLSLLLGGCAGFDGFWDDLRGTPQVYSQRSIPLVEWPAFPRSCLAGDVETPDLAQCSSVNGACYQLDTGNWCSGPGTGVCQIPPVPLGSDCPAGAQCWQYHPNLRCRSA